MGGVNLRCECNTEKVEESSGRVVVVKPDAKEKEQRIAL